MSHPHGPPDHGAGLDAYDSFLRSLSSDASTGSGSAPDVGTYRIVVATDWSNVTLLVTVARAYAAMIPASAPVSLVVTVPRAVSLEDAAALDVILAEAAPDGGLRAELESFTQTAQRPALIAFVPGGDEHVLLAELGRGLANLHHLATHVTTPGAVAASPPPRQGTMRGLPERLRHYAERPGPSVPPTL